MISQITPTGCNPARVIKSTAASVWPARFKTPPLRAISGLTWPGRLKSPGTADGAASFRIVSARSAALLPVVVPSLASTVIVNAVRIDSLFSRTISSKFSAISRSSGIGTVIMPDAWRVISVIASAVICSAAITQSPSFSRSSSSTRMTILPAFKSASASSIV